MCIRSFVNLISSLLISIIATGQVKSQHSILNLEPSKPEFDYKIQLEHKNVVINNKFTEDDYKHPRFNKMVSLSNAVIESKADFHSSAFMGGANFLGAVFKQGAHFESVSFNGVSSFVRTKFLKYTSFRGSNFDTLQGADFRHAEFNEAVYFSSISPGHGGEPEQENTVFGPVKFNNAKFDQGAAFASVIFQGDADFSMSNFENGAQFSVCDFNRSARFDQAKFATLGKDVSFRAVTFSGLGSFSKTEFYGFVDFTVARFKKEALFDRLKFDQDLDLSEAKFYKSLDLSRLNMSTGSKLSFFKSELPYLFDFSNNPQLRHEVNLTDANFETSLDEERPKIEHTYINLYKTEIEKVRIDYIHFRLCFFDPENDEPNLKELIEFDGDTILVKGYGKTAADGNEFAFLWRLAPFRDYIHRVFPFARLSDPVIKVFVSDCVRRGNFPHSLSDDAIISIYEKVLNDLSVRGLRVSHQTLDIEYNDFRNGAFILPGLWNSYGYHKERIFIWTGVMLLIFTIITTFYLPKLNKKPEDGGIYYIENIHIPDYSGSWNAIRHRVWNSIMYTATIFFLFSLKIENLNFKKTAVLYIIVVYSAGILCVGYIAAFVLGR